MKYVIMIGDGMADDRVTELKGRTPLEHARTPNMDRLATEGELGLFRSVPGDLPPGSDVANLSILGYDPRKYYTGRAPFEAANMGVELSPTDVAFRCNLVSLTDYEGAFVMADYSAGHITTEEAAEIIETLDAEFKDRNVRFYPGKSYRHLMVWENGSEDMVTVPPHDISDKEIERYIPNGEEAFKLNALMARSWEVLKDHPVNVKRREAGKNTADSIWLWGQGKAPELPTLKEVYGINGGMISAVDLLNGIGLYAGLEVIDVPGITGYLDTDYQAKASYARTALKVMDFVCIHVEAPDEAGHQGLVKEKVQAIEDFDEKIVGPVLKGLEEDHEDYRVLVISDHPTPVELKTHTRDPVPFVIYGSGVSEGVQEVARFTESCAVKTGLIVEEATDLLEAFLGHGPV